MRVFTLYYIILFIDLKSKAFRYQTLFDEFL